MQFSADGKVTVGHVSSNVGVASPKVSFEGTCEVPIDAPEVSTQLGFGLQGVCVDFDKGLSLFIESILDHIKIEQHKLFKLNPSGKQRVVKDLQHLGFKLYGKKINWRFEEEEVYEDEYKQKVFSLYLLRVAYFQFAKLYLLKTWVEIGLVSQEEIKKDGYHVLSRILFESQKNLITHRQTWAFSKQNAYSWFQLSTGDIFKNWEKIEKIQFVNQKGLIPRIYSHYVKREQEFKETHFFSPEVSEFVIKKISKDGLVRQLGHIEKPKMVLNLGAQAGFFLSHLFYDLSSFESRNDLRIDFFSSSFAAVEKDYFSYLFTEMTYLSLMSPLFNFKLQLCVPLLHYHPLRLIPSNTLPGTGVRPQYTEEETLLGIEDLSGEQEKLYGVLKATEKFDFCILSGEKEERDNIKSYLHVLPELKQFYEANAPLLSWHVILSLLKLREGGKLIVLSHDYWPLEVHAKKLRRFVLDHAKILEIYDFGKFLQPRYLFVLQKCYKKEERDKQRIKLCKLKSHFDYQDISKLFEISESVQALSDIYSDEKIEVFFGPVLQEDLNENVWSCLEEFTYLPMLKRIKEGKVPLASYYVVKKPKDEGEGHQDLLEFIPKDQVLVKDQNFIYRSKEDPDQDGQYVLSPKTSTYFSPKLLALFLNSSVIRFWYKLQSSTVSKGYYVQQDLQQTPLPPLHVSEIKSEVQSEKQAQVVKACERRDIDYLRGFLFLELLHGDQNFVSRCMESLFDEQCRVIEKLKSFDNFRKEREVNWCEIKKIYPLQLQVSFKDHKQVYVDSRGESLQSFCFLVVKRLKHPHSNEEFLQVMSLDNQFLSIHGHPIYLNLLEQELSKLENLYWDEIEQSLYLPKEVKMFEAFQEEIFGKWMEFSTWKKNIRELLDDLVFRFYGFNPDDTNQFKAKEASNFISLIKETSSI
ncbi:MAG TPA: hypothetical protein VJB34_03460 [Bdellovibrionota bacterium]|nr:hypothetical protein [Bdellovibrionota bacterium]